MAEGARSLSDYTRAVLFTPAVFCREDMGGQLVRLNVNLSTLGRELRTLREQLGLTHNGA
jgi:hypothetical protein